jgi:hypothetical protein
VASGVIAQGLSIYEALRKSIADEAGAISSTARVDGGRPRAGGTAAGEDRPNGTTAGA